MFFQLLCNITPAHLFCPIHSQAMTTLKSFLKDCKDGKVEKVQRAIARGFDVKNGHLLPTGQWYAPSAVIKHAWYCMVLHGVAWYCMVLHGIACYCMVLHGIA